MYVCRDVRFDGVRSGCSKVSVQAMLLRSRIVPCPPGIFVTSHKSARTHASGLIFGNVTSRHLRLGWKIRVLSWPMRGSRGWFVVLARARELGLVYRVVTCDAIWRTKTVAVVPAQPHSAEPRNFPDSDVCCLRSSVAAPTCAPSSPWVWSEKFKGAFCCEAFGTLGGRCFDAAVTCVWLCKLSARKGFIFSASQERAAQSSPDYGITARTFAGNLESPGSINNSTNHGHLPLCTFSSDELRAEDQIVRSTWFKQVALKQGFQIISTRT